MSNSDSVAPLSKQARVSGWILTILPAGMLIFSGLMKLAGPAAVLEEFSRLGYAERVIIPIGIVEIACAVIYLVPRTAVLGAILITGYLGGATATHVRVGDPTFFMPPLIGVVAWLGIFIRDPRLRALIPWRVAPRSAA